MRYAQIFWTFLLLGLTSFGGPAAHLGYFRRVFVEDKAWLDSAHYARLIALSQFLPGPSSSQVGFAIGCHRGGLLGGLLAFLGFTLPSFALMLAVALLGQSWSQHALVIQVIHGLKLVAVVVVCDALLSMAGHFCQSRFTWGLAYVTAGVTLIVPSMAAPLLILLAASALGAIYLQGTPTATSQEEAAPSLVKWALLLFLGLFIGGPYLAQWIPELRIWTDFYLAGSLVFGGGHVVLPLLQASVGAQLTGDQFLMGYAAAQALPGPMFSFASFLGATLWPQSAFWGALVATLAIFTPGFLGVIALQKAWHHYAKRPRLAGAVAGLNASVVGLLMAALYQPVFVSAVFKPMDMACVLVGFWLLRVLKISVLWLIGLALCLSLVIGLSGL